MNQVFESFENLVKAQNSYSNDKKKMLDKLLLLISQPTSQNIKEIKQIAKQFTEKGKDYYSLMQKYSKSVEKKLKFDLDFVWDPKAFHDKDAILIKIIIQHFVRQGRFDIAKKLSEESNVDHEEKMSSEYSQMFQIQEQLRNENVDLAIEWATQHSRFLQEFNSSLEFQLHQMKYLKFVQSGQLKNALGYAQSILYKFADTKLSSS
jgi:E3 ubiquitin-protein transferase RMND5